MSNMLGPSVTALRRQVHVGVGTIAWLFAATSAGYLLGSLASGILYDRRYGHRLYAASIFVAVACFAVIVSTSSFVVLAAAFAVGGVAMASVDVGGNTLLVWQRAGAVGPFMNALHLCFGVGALIAPILVNRSLAWHGNLRLAWLVLAGVAALAVLWLGSCRAPEHAEAKQAARAGELVFTDDRLVGIVAFFFVLYVGLEIGFAGWIHTYAEEIRLGSANTVSAVTTLFWVAFTLGRLGAVGVARRHRPSTILRTVSVLTVVASGALVVANGRAAGVWVGTALFGLAVAPQFPTMIAFAEEHLTLTGSATSWFFGASAIGGFVFPWLIGKLFGAVGAKAMPVVVFLASIATLGWFAIVERSLRGSDARERPSVGARV